MTRPFWPLTNWLWNCWQRTILARLAPCACAQVGVEAIKPRPSSAQSRVFVTVIASLLVKEIDESSVCLAATAAAPASSADRSIQPLQALPACRFVLPCASLYEGTRLL